MLAENQKEIQKITKLLELSASNIDAEALLAVRKANEIRKKINASWQDLFTPRIQHTNHQSNTSYRGASQKRDSHYVDVPDDELVAIFDELIQEREFSEKWEEIIESIHKYWCEHGGITEKQYALIMKLYGND
jgi:exonuclease V gamma subunit